MSESEYEIANHTSLDVSELAAALRGQNPLFRKWAEGYGVIKHQDVTQVRIYGLAETLIKAGKAKNLDEILHKLIAADRLTSAAMWIVVHMTYATRVDLEGQPLAPDDFKHAPEGHTGGSLNVAPAYVGYFLANALTGETRSWVMGQGHTVAAIESVNLLLENQTPQQKDRYTRDAAGLQNLVRDFYSYAIAPDGSPGVPLGSHANPNTAGATMEGGYLGFAEVEYVHMPLKGEKLVAILSDGAFEEQRGSEWSSRWWRPGDSGLVSPIMILNGRRIEERSEIEQQGGTEWLNDHLRINNFDPIDIDGTDPAAFAWAILISESKLEGRGALTLAGKRDYPIRLPYTVARTIKGYGFPGAGTNRAHGTPLIGNPRHDEAARKEFNEGAAALFVSPAELEESIATFNVHAEQDRPKEGDHPIASRNVATPTFPETVWSEVGVDVSPMAAVDRFFVDLVKANPNLRPRVGNPDELGSNQMGQTLAHLKHRVNVPEEGVPESTEGAIITALNEEAVIGAALGNKGGLNLSVSYEAFAVKMLGALRQDIIFARHQKHIGKKPGWIGVPVIATSHAWENGKNEQSHQDPTLAEALLGEMSDTSRVLFPVDANTAVEAMRTIYRDNGTIGTLVISKRPVPSLVSPELAVKLYETGAATFSGNLATADVQLIALGSYQLVEAIKAAKRLEAKGVNAAITIVVEPGRLREPRDHLEGKFVLSDAELEALFPARLPRVVVTHTRPEPIIGVLRRIDGGPSRMRVLGYVNRGGTLDAAGLLFANYSTWAHIARAAAKLIGKDAYVVLTEDEVRTIDGHGNPHLVMNAAF
ncbi:xylulose 5-phosphate 3-epimerase [Rhodomicrobium sp. Az07]|uniref:xylulose 5-phosphate 3-epimerase n=1 Tax=Rhodomicrobium sp. Az07 TaxID=2839034 RepID=UPI002036F50C|nr:xylulose 5-phosphate 3-epimerase [Rhodomicrobium sp. Az07]